MLFIQILFEKFSNLKILSNMIYVSCRSSVAVNPGLNNAETIAVPLNNLSPKEKITNLSDIKKS